MENQKITIITNACATDDIRITPIVNSWLRIFGDRILKIIIVKDLKLPSGRIAALHDGLGSNEKILSAIEKLILTDNRIYSVDLPKSKKNLRLLSHWFIGNKIPYRCQAGTPILPFIFAMDFCDDDLVLRLDCDMVFHESGFLSKAMEVIQNNEYDLVEPYRWSS